MTNYPTQLDEIDQWLADNFGILPGACASTENLRHNTARMIAEALWPRQEEPQELDEAAEEYSGKKCDKLNNAFKAGANWQKEQDHDACYQCEKDYDIVFYKGVQHAIKMMKEEAIETTIVNDWTYGKDPDHSIIPAIHQRIDGVKVGDKVKVYIFKEERK